MRRTAGRPSGVVSALLISAGEKSLSVLICIFLFVSGVTGFEPAAAGVPRPRPALGFTRRSTRKMPSGEPGSLTIISGLRLKGQGLRLRLF